MDYAKEIKNMSAQSLRAIRPYWEMHRRNAEGNEFLTDYWIRMLGLLDQEIKKKEGTNDSMSKGKKSSVYPIAGDTIHERKRSVQLLLQRLGYRISLSQITQTKGVLSVRWEPPFAEHLMEHMETFAKYGAVFFVPDKQEAKLAWIDLVFEQEPGLFVFDLLLSRPVIIESLDRLPVLLAYHVECMQKQKQRSEEAQSDDVSESESVPKQQSLW